jgi:hypothetical protein
MNDSSPPDALLALTDQEEAISRAYIQAVAASAGYVVATMDFDRDGIDVELKAGGLMRPAIGVQLKATINLGQPNEGSFRYSLKRRNYDLLRIPTQVPRILVVLNLPRDQTSWMTITNSELTMRHCAYWAALLSKPEVHNSDSVTVSIPEMNVLNTNSLQALMERSRTGTVA